MVEMLLGDGTIDEMVRWGRQVWTEAPRDEPMWHKNVCAVYEKYLPYILYLCSDEPDVVAITRPGKKLGWKPKPHKIAVGKYKVIPPKEPEVWHAGFRLGRRLREARESYAPQTGTKRPHMRKAHWHWWWVGNGENRRRKFKWLPPIPVMGGPDRPTVKRVTHESRVDA